MSEKGYEVCATLPMEIGRGKIEDPKENSTSKIESPKERNEKYGFIEIKAQTTRTKIRTKETKSQYNKDEGR